MEESIDLTSQNEDFAGYHGDTAMGATSMGNAMVLSKRVEICQQYMAIFMEHNDKPCIFTMLLCIYRGPNFQTNAYGYYLGLICASIEGFGFPSNEKLVGGLEHFLFFPYIRNNNPN
jgi:hypothetical protein